MIIERMRIIALPGGAQQLGRALASLTGPMGVQPGCLSCRTYQSLRDTSELLVEMDWETTGDLIHHLQTETYKQLLLLMELSPRAPIVEFYTVEEMRGLDLVESARDGSSA